MKTKKLIYFFTVIVIIMFAACQNDPVENLSLGEMFESLPTPAQISLSSGMNANVTFQENGPNVTNLYYKDALLSSSIYYSFIIINPDIAIGECRYGILIIYNKEKSYVYGSEDLLNKPFFETVLGSYEARQDNNFIYIKGRNHSVDQTSFTDVYFKYSILDNEMTNEAGQKLILTK
jgi:hypothetical protein